MGAGSWKIKYIELVSIHIFISLLSDLPSCLSRLVNTGLSDRHHRHFTTSCCGKMAAWRSKVYALHCHRNRYLSLFFPPEGGQMGNNISLLPRGKYWHCCIGRLENLVLSLFTITEITSDLSQTNL